MKLKLSNVAKIENAELELLGITVIAGKNNTGKSTVGKTVFSVFNSLVNIEEKITSQKQSLIFQMLDRKSEDLSANTEINQELFGEVIPGNLLRRYARELVIRDRKEEQRRILKEYLGRIMKYREPDSSSSADILIEEIDKIKQIPIERLSQSVVSAYFKHIFNSEINSVYQPESEAVIEAEIGQKGVSIVFAHNNCVELQQQVKILNEAVYLDNPFILDSLNNGIYGLNEVEKNTAKKLLKNSDVVEAVVQRNIIEDKIQEVLAKINTVSSGSLLQDESRSYYYREQGMNGKLNINNLSAGLKSFVIIKTLLENGSLKQKDILILDEPEIHLHPDWQLLFAEIIILLQKAFDLTLILTTHSSHFLEALLFYAEKYGRKDKCTCYLSEISEHGCKLKDVTADPTEIYAQLVDASILLDRLKFNMEEAKDE